MLYYTRLGAAAGALLLLKDYIVVRFVLGEEDAALATRTPRFAVIDSVKGQCQHAYTVGSLASGITPTT